MEKEEYFLDEMEEMKRIVERLYLFHKDYEDHEIQRILERINLISNDLLFEIYGVKIETIYPDE